MWYLLAIVAGIIFGVWASMKIVSLLWENEKQSSEAHAESAANHARYEILQEYLIQEKREKMKAYEMLFQVFDIASKNTLYPSQSTTKPLPYYPQNAEIETSNAVYTPNDTIQVENKPIGEGGVKMMSKTIARKGVSEYLISQDENYKFSETEKGIILDIKGKRYVCDYAKEKGTTVKVSVFPMYLGKCSLPSCDNNFLTKEQSTKHCCDKHKNENHNSK